VFLTPQNQVNKCIYLLNPSVSKDKRMCSFVRYQKLPFKKFLKKYWISLSQFKDDFPGSELWAEPFPSGILMPYHFLQIFMTTGKIILILIPVSI
jgi:hypothetical protein